MSPLPDTPLPPFSGRSRLWSVVVLVPLYLLCVLGAGLLWSRPWVLAGLFAAVGVVLLWRWHGPSDLYFFFTAFVLGPVGEWLAVSMGAWSYHGLGPGLELGFGLGLPPWLPFAWGITMLFLKRTSEALFASGSGAEAP